MRKYKKDLSAFITRREQKFYVVYEGEAFEVNEVGARILELCNGENSVADIAEKLSKVYSLSPDVIGKDVEEYIQLLLSEKLIS